MAAAIAALYLLGAAVGLLGWGAADMVRHLCCGTAYDRAVRMGPPQWEAGRLLWFLTMDAGRAGLNDLTAVPGIGAAGAARFLEYRDTLGFFLDHAELYLPGSGLSMRETALLGAYLDVDIALHVR